jgi:hypothetical protein
MHPQLHHQTTTTPYDEARWLGFFHMGAQTAPAKTTSVATVAPATPTPRKTASKTKGVVSPEFKFTFKRQSSVELSPEARKMMAESREEAAKIRARMSALPPIPDTEPGEPSAPAEDKTQHDITERKIVKPKGKAGRFSSAHLAEFKKMDSIENHPSAWRLNTERFAAVTKSLKRSPSKAELDKSESNPFLRPASTAAVGFSGTTSSAKRVKQTHTDDAARTRPMFQENKPTPTPTPKSNIPTKSAIPRSLSHLMTPTKASLARSQSVKNLRATNKLPGSSLVRSKSVKSLRFTPHTPQAQVDGRVSKPTSPTPIKVADFKEDTPIKVPVTLVKSPSPSSTDTGNSTPKIKSILRTPQRLYSDDPSKIAAGTHLATPPDARRHLSPFPATAPVVKHVDFTASALDKARRDEAKAASVEPETIRYPTLSAEPEDRDGRRSTISSLPIPGSFTFRSGTPIVFAPSKPAKPTIRAVRGSDVGLAPVSEEPSSTSNVGYPQLPTPGKRKLEFLGQIHEEPESEKENRNEEEDDRPAKKMRKLESSPSVSTLSPTKHTPRKLIKKSRLPTSASKRAAGLSAARLNLLSQPKRRA